MIGRDRNTVSIFNLFEWVEEAMSFDPEKIPTPCYVADIKKVKSNLDVLRVVQERTSAKIILAQKGFAMFHLYPLIREVLHGTTASSLHEALLGREEFGGEVHVYSPAYLPQEMDLLLNHVDHMVFNSLSQWERFRPLLQAHRRSISAGIRINPEFSEVETEIYNPCARFSRLGVPLRQFKWREFRDLDGIHFHSHCASNSGTLARTVEWLESQIADVFHQVKWINFGGGHHITRADYDVDLLCEVIEHVTKTYQVQVYLEPGEAVALNAGYLVVSVIDFVSNDKEIALLDTSASTHMPDVLEMPYRPPLEGAGLPGEFPFTYRLGGMTCLAGDVIGDYSFPQPLRIGQKLVFGDMLHYSMVKNTTFNGVGLPSIGVWNENDQFEMVRKFGYSDYKMRLS